MAILKNPKQFEDIFLGYVQYSDTLETKPLTFKNTVFLSKFNPNVKVFLNDIPSMYNRNT